MWNEFKEFALKGNALSLAGAFRYATSRWTALTRYVGDGRLELSNNAAERAIRPLALARLNDVDPEAWLGDVISRTADHPNTKIDELLPWKWSAAGSKAIAA
jgi:transposase